MSRGFNTIFAQCQRFSNDNTCGEQSLTTIEYPKNYIIFSNDVKKHFSPRYIPV